MTALEQGVALLGGGRFHEALQQFAQALRDNPISPEPRIGLSQACLGIGDGWAGAAWLSDACRVAPQRADIWAGLAALLASTQRDAELEPLLSTARQLHPQDPQLLRVQAELLLRSRRYAAALQAYVNLHPMLPQDPVTSMHLGFCLEQEGRVPEAVDWYRYAISQQANLMEAHVNLAGVLWRVEDFEGAVAHAKKAVQLAPEHPYAVRILGTALLNMNKLEEAEAQLRRSLELLPGFPLAEMDLAFCKLLAGRMEEGWELYSRRWHDPERMKRPGFFVPKLEWKGPVQEPLKGKRILVYAEQGLGDVIQFIRYLPQMQEEGATVACVIQPELVPLVEHSMPGIKCLQSQDQFQTDYIVALMDLPMHYRTTLDTIPSKVPYLQPPPEKVEDWKALLAPWNQKKRKRVGIAWSGSLDQVNNQNRAMRLSDLVPLTQMEGVRCFSLQKADAGALTDVKVDRESLVDWTREWKDFTESAAMLRNLDLVITVDTAVAHLAGAMGLPVWVMLGPNADWRWLLEREDSPWYPTMRLFRRGIGEARSAQVERVKHALQQWLPKPR